MDNLTKEQRKKNMQSIRSTHTLMENKITFRLWKDGYRFRKNVKSLPGKPDIAINKYKIVIFLDSCFWHKCPYHFKNPKSNQEYWGPKIERNIKHDEEINKYYIDKGWNLLRIWEHDVKQNFEETIINIKMFIDENSLKS